MKFVVVFRERKQGAAQGQLPRPHTTLKSATLVLPHNMKNS